MAEAPNTYLSPVAIERGCGDSPLDTTPPPPTLYPYGVVTPPIYGHPLPIPNLSPIQNIPLQNHHQTEDLSLIPMETLSKTFHYSGT